MSVRTTNLPQAAMLAELIGHRDTGAGAMATERLPLAWATYTPVFTSGTGILGTYTINRARWVRVGWTVTVAFDMTITSAGSSPAGSIVMTLPVPSKSGFPGSVQGREQVTGRLIGGVVDGDQQRARFSFDSFASAAGNGNRLVATVIYEAE